MDRSIQPRKSDAFHDNRVRGPIESNRIESSSGNSTVSKRKYRRHPKVISSVSLPDQGRCSFFYQSKCVRNMLSAVQCIE